MKVTGYITIGTTLVYSGSSFEVSTMGPKSTDPKNVDAARQGPPGSLVLPAVAETLGERLKLAGVPHSIVESCPESYYRHAEHIVARYKECNPNYTANTPGAFDVVRPVARFFPSIALEQGAPGHYGALADDLRKEGVDVYFPCAPQGVLAPGNGKSSPSFQAIFLPIAALLAEPNTIEAYQCQVTASHERLQAGTLVMLRDKRPYPFYGTCQLPPADAARIMEQLPSLFSGVDPRPFEQFSINEQRAHLGDWNQWAKIA